MHDDNSSNCISASPCYEQPANLNSKILSFKSFHGSKFCQVSYFLPRFLETQFKPLQSAPLNAPKPPWVRATWDNNSSSSGHHTADPYSSLASKPAGYTLQFPAWSVLRLQTRFLNTLLIVTISNWCSNRRELSQESKNPITKQFWFTEQEIQSKYHKPVHTNFNPHYIKLHRNQSKNSNQSRQQHQSRMPQQHFILWLLDNYFIPLSPTSNSTR